MEPKKTILLFSNDGKCQCEMSKDGSRFRFLNVELNYNYINEALDYVNKHFRWEGPQTVTFTTALSDDTKSYSRL